METIFSEALSNLYQLDGNFISECLDLSIQGDTVCFSGFGDVFMEVEEAVVAYKDQNGNIVTEIDLASIANPIFKYRLITSLLFAVIMAAIY